MKPIILFCCILTTFLIGCSNTNQKESSINNTDRLTVRQLDSIRHTYVNDSINHLDTIRLFGSLFMEMSPEEYNENKEKVLLPVKIGGLEFNLNDTSLFHNTLHGVTLKACYSDYAYGRDGMMENIRHGEELFQEVINTLSNKYGKGSVYGLTKLDDLGRQYGNVMWIFDKMTIEYEHRQTTDPSNREFNIDAKIKYYIPRIETSEEKQRSDSIYNVYEKQMNEQKQRNEEAKRGL